MKVVISTQAREDLREIGDYVAQDNPRRARALVAELGLRAFEIGERPYAFQQLEGFETLALRRRVYEPYLIIYRIQPDRVSIVRIVHGARDLSRIFPSERRLDLTPGLTPRPRRRIPARMSEIIPLAAGFTAPTEADWRALVEKTLKGESVESLVSHPSPELDVQPLYPASNVAGVGPRDLRARDPQRPWDLRTVIAAPSPAVANAQVLEDLEGGAASVVVKIDPTGARGVAVGSAADLARVLDKQVVELAPVALDAGYLGVEAADWLAAFAKASPGALLALHLDPLSAFAETGHSPGPIESHLIAAATTAVRLADIHPKASLFLASGRVVHEAGGSEAQELGFAAAAALAYAKALVRAGQSMEAAFAHIVLGLTADADYFLTIAKLRAARAVWARLTGACGVSVPAGIEARSSQRMLTRQAPWTNLVRLTAAGFGAAAGGADAILLSPFTDALGAATSFARRQSRNTQLMLMEESQAGRIADPAGGSGYLETLTDEIARAAWAEFQTIERAGGVIAALTSGVIAGHVQAARDTRLDALKDGKTKIVGVTNFAAPDIREAPVETFEPATAAAPDPRKPGPDGVCAALAPIHFETLLSAEPAR